ncbi:hypothetical protein ACFCX4_35025 [Kitasatospora sp. NPDC056327]|uniref:hypothetical protein n=1 Tax=Kitasatospora sp. NPDC056327 TaxID=3345785 RepID=UPI0035D5BBD1
MNLASTTLPPAVATTVAVTAAARAADGTAGATGETRSEAAFTRPDGRGNRAGDGRRGRHPDLKPFWPSRQPHLFDQTCPGSPSASRHSFR